MDEIVLTIILCGAGVVVGFIVIILSVIGICFYVRKRRRNAK